MRGERVGDAAVVVDLPDDADDFRRHLLAELHIALELGDGRAGKCFGLDALTDRVLEHDRFRFVKLGAIGILEDPRALGSLDQQGCSTLST